jgi:hypothetical protein
MKEVEETDEEELWKELVQLGCYMTSMEEHRL